MYKRKTVALSGTATLARPVGSTKAFITVEGSIRFCYDGTAATSTTGHLAPTGAQIELEGSEINNFKCYGVEATTLQITYTVG